MTEGEEALFVMVENAPSYGIFKSAYNQLCRSIGNRVAAEYGHPIYDFDLADAALEEADDGPEGAAYFARYETLLRAKYAALTPAK